MPLENRQVFLLDIGSLSKFKTVNCKPKLAEFTMASVKPKVEISFERLEIATDFNGSLTFSTMLDLFSSG